MTNINQAELEKMLSDNPELSIEGRSIPAKPYKGQQMVDKARQVWLDSHPTKRRAVIRMVYPGGVITENHAYGRNGKHSYMKAEALEWQNDLIVRVKSCGVHDWQLPLKIRIEGTFKNLRQMPDLHNLKLLFDGIQKAIGLNDKHFYTETIPGVIDKTVKPIILITIEEI
jgi:hypothetical protein